MTGSQRPSHKDKSFAFKRGTLNAQARVPLLIAFGKTIALLLKSKILIKVPLLVVFKLRLKGALVLAH